MSFDMLAPSYGTLKRIAFGDDLQRCRVACLSEIDPPRRALIVGEGNGRFLCELLRLHPEVEVDCIDASQQMLQLARKRVDRELAVIPKREDAEGPRNCNFPHTEKSHALPAVDA